MPPLRTWIIAAVLGVGAWYAVKSYAAYQTLEQLQACGRQIDLSGRFKKAGAAAERRALLIMEIECMDRKLGFPASLFFDKNAAIASIRFNDKETRPEP